MNVDNLRQNAGRWVRVGVLTLTTFGPLINVVASRLRERAKKLQQDASTRGQATLAQSQGQLIAVGASLNDALSDLKDNPYSQQLLKRGSELAGTLTDQSSKLSQAVAERGSKATQAVVERGSDIARDVAERSNKVTQEFAKQGQRTTREVSHRTQRAAQKAQRELLRASSQVRSQATRIDYVARFWSVLGFIVGLISAITTAYLLVRRRFQNSTREDAVVQLPNRVQLNGASGTVNKATATHTNAPAISSTPVSTPTAQSSIPAVMPTQASLTVTSEPLTTDPQSEDIVSADETVLPVESVETATASGLLGDDESPTIKHGVVSNTLASTVEQSRNDLNTRSSSVASPAILGVVSTKRYYPVETPLSDLKPANGDDLDVIYFANAGEAEAQGYSAAV